MHENAEISASNAPGGSVSWVLTRDDLMHLVEMIRNAETVVMDLETTGLNEWARTNGPSNGGVAARVVMASLTLPQLRPGPDGPEWDGEEPPTYIVPLSHPDSPFLGQWVSVLRFIARAIKTFNRPFINQHAKFDTRWIFAATSKLYLDPEDGQIVWEPGIDLTPLIVWDTQSSSHLLDETQSTKLKDAAPRTFGIPPWDDHDLSTPGAAERVDFWELGEYAARDTYWTWRLWRQHLHQMFLDEDDPFAMPFGDDEQREARLGLVAKYVSMPTARSLGHMEQRGIRLDIDYVREHLAEQREIASTRLDELAEKYRLPRETASTAATSGWFKQLTEQAIASGELRIASMTARGNAQWDKFVLRKQAARGSETARLVLEQRDAAKQAEFLTSWLEKVDPRGFIHSTFRAGHVTTGRLSSADPNLQQVAKKLRLAFIPRDGHAMADFDYSQLELRVAAFISRSAPMIEAFETGQDLHRRFAADIATRRRWAEDATLPAVTLEEVSEEERQRAKAGNFGLLYLQQAEGFRSYAEKSYGVELTEAEAHEIYDGFFQTWEGMAEWHQRVIREASVKGYVTSPIGRVRNVPDIFSGNDYLRGAAQRQAVNSPVQGFGSDLMQLAIASIYGILPGSSRVEGAHPVATVHDSLVAEIELDRWEEIAEHCQERMVDLDSWLSRMGCRLDVPLVADASIGTRWGLSDINHPTP